MQGDTARDTSTPPTTAADWFCQSMFARTGFVSAGFQFRFSSGTASLQRASGTWFAVFISRRAVPFTTTARRVGIPHGGAAVEQVRAGVTAPGVDERTEGELQ